MKLDLIEYQRLTEQKQDIKYVLKDIAESNHEAMQQDVEVGVSLLTNWLNQAYHESKRLRLTYFKTNNDLAKVVENVINRLLAHCNTTMEFTVAVGLTKNCFKQESLPDQVKTASEVLAVLSSIGLYSTYKHPQRGVFMLDMHIELDEESQSRIHNTQYRMPSVLTPEDVKPRDYIGLTSKESMVLGEGTHCNEIATDSLNRFNQVPLSLNVNMLTTFSEQAPEFTNLDHAKQWEQMVNESYGVYKELIQLGNHFYIYHKYDKRGRTYACGYHVNPQGNSFRKAIVELTNKELVEDKL